MKSWWKTTNDASKNSFSYSPSISTGHMSDKKQNIWDLKCLSCNNSIPFASTRTRTHGLELLWSWMVHDAFACLSYWWGRIPYDYCIYQSKLLPQQFWNSVVTCRHKFHVGHLWDQKAFSSKSDTCFYDRVCKQLFFDPLYLHHPCYCCKSWWC